VRREERKAATREAIDGDRTQPAGAWQGRASKADPLEDFTAEAALAAFMAVSTAASVMAEGRRF
jgi:hypothetical protein